MMMVLGPIKLNIVTLFVVFHLRTSEILASLPFQTTKRGRVTEKIHWRNERIDNGYHRIIRIRGGDSNGSKHTINDDETISDSHLFKHPFLPIAITVAFDAVPTMVVEVESFFRDRVVPRLRDAREEIVRRIDDNRGGEIESYFLDRVLPRARDARERFVQRMDDHRKRKERERQEQLKRNEMWREIAERGNWTPVAPSSTKRKKNGQIRLSSYASSSIVPGSVQALGSSPGRPVSLKTALLPTRVLKLSLVAIFLAEALDRIGVLYEDTPEIVKTRIQHFWRYDVLRVYGNIRSRLEGWYNRRLRRWILELRMGDVQQELRRTDSGWWRWRWIGHRPYDGPAVWSTTKVAFTAGMAGGMIAAPLLSSCFARIWRPVLAVVAFAETNHHFKTRGRKFVEVLGETPQTLGATLDGLLERFRQIVREAIHRILQSKENTYYEPYGSGNKKSGSFHDRYGDTTTMGLMGRSSGVSWRKDETAKRSNTDDYSIGISPYGPKSNRDSIASRAPGDNYNGWRFSKGRVMRDFDDSDECTIEVYNRTRMMMAKLGLAVGCTIGIAMKGR